MPLMMLVLAAPDSTVGHAGPTLVYLAVIACVLMPLMVLFYAVGSAVTVRLIQGHARRSNPFRAVAPPMAFIEP